MKTVERVVAARISVHTEFQQLLPGHQSVYRAYHSTETAVPEVHDDIIHSGKVCVFGLLDLSAAFDTVDHDGLLQARGRRFGVEGLVLNWFESYLTDRT